MNNNDILRRLRYIFDFSDDKMIELFSLSDFKVTRTQVSNWLKKDDEQEFKECRDIELAVFLNGLITSMRGEKEGEKPEPEKKLNNNIILRKIKIALNLKAEDILEIMDSAGLGISKHELSAFFRNPSHRHYMECNDQILRRFLKGLQVKYRKS